jgi:hypothetical protein
MLRAALIKQIAPMLIMRGQMLPPTRKSLPQTAYTSAREKRCRNTRVALLL